MTKRKKKQCQPKGSSLPECPPHPTKDGNLSEFSTVWTMIDSKYLHGKNRE